MQELETTIRRHLMSFLAEDTTLDEFTDWLVGTAWSIEHTGSADAKQLVYAIELALAEASSGLLTLDELRSELGDLSLQMNLNLSSQV